MAGPQSSWGRSFATLLLFAGIAAGGYYAWTHYGAPGAKGPGSAAPGAGNAKEANAAVPVTVTTVRKGDFPVYLNGLGTVEPYQTVTVRSRVDGQVLKVNFRQGQIVQEGQELVQIDPRPYQAALDQAVAKKTQDEASLKNAETNLERYKTLSQENFTSRQQFETQQSTVAQLTAQIQGDQGAIDHAKTQVSYTIIHSPLTGRAGFRTVDPGNIVHASDSTGIVTIVKLQPISVVFTAPQEDVTRISDALSKGEVPVEALSSDGTKVIAAGHLALINNQVDQASGTIQMKATFANKDNILWPGLSVSTRLLVETMKSVLAVPDVAVQRGVNGLYVYVAGDDGKAHVQNVKVSQEGDGQSVVAEGLTEGEKVVQAGQYRLTDGSPIRPETPSPPPGGDKVAQTSTKQVP